ncbi:MAG: glycosyltransferase [Planctomycetota bacterium]
MSDAASPHQPTVAFLGWARLRMQAEEGSGYNLSASELAAGLAETGVVVHYLGSGLRYDLRPGPRIRRTEPWRGIECWELVNSPNLAPSALNLRNVSRERSCPATTRLVLRWLSRIGARIVHAHSLEGLSLDLIPAIEAAGIRVVVTTHNYWFACPQVDLLHREREVCLDFEGGRRCAECLDAPNPAVRRLKRRVGQSIERVTGERLAGSARSALGGMARAVADRKGEEDAPIDEQRMLGYDPNDAHAEGGYGLELRDGAIGPPPPVLPGDTNERVLANADVHLRVLNEYGRRREDGIAALNAASLVTPPSAFLGTVHVSMGLDEARLRVVRLGQPHFDRMHRAAMAAPGYRCSPWTPNDHRPLRLGFFGTTRPNKGLRVLVDAIGALPAEVRRRCQFLIRASGWDWPFRKRLSRYPQVQFAGGFDLLQRVASVGEYDVGVLPHIWMENSPLVLLEHLHAGKMVITSRLGGPPEWIERDGEATNGLLFPSGDAGALAGCIASIVRGDVAIPSPERIHRLSPHLQSYPGHVGEVRSIYDELLVR